MGKNKKKMTELEFKDFIRRMDIVDDAISTGIWSDEAKDYARIMLAWQQERKDFQKNKSK